MDSKQQRKWYARIDHHGQRHWLGAHRSERAAARARDDAAFALHGEFAHLNFPCRHRHRERLTRIRQRLSQLWARIQKHPPPRFLKE